MSILLHVRNEGITSPEATARDWTEAISPLNNSLEQLGASLHMGGERTPIDCMIVALENDAHLPATRKVLREAGFEVVREGHVDSSE